MNRQCRKCGLVWKQRARGFVCTIKPCSIQNRAISSKARSDRREIKDRRNAQQRKRWKENPKYRETNVAWHRAQYQTNALYRERRKQNRRRRYNERMATDPAFRLKRQKEWARWRDFKKARRHEADKLQILQSQAPVQPHV
jgi:hypothetical protein